MLKRNVKIINLPAEYINDLEMGRRRDYYYRVPDFPYNIEGLYLLRREKKLVVVYKGQKYELKEERAAAIFNNYLDRSEGNRRINNNLYESLKTLISYRIKLTEEQLKILEIEDWHRISRFYQLQHFKILKDWKKV